MNTLGSVAYKQLLYPWKRDLLESVVALLITFPAFYGTHRFTNEFSRTQHWALYNAKMNPDRNITSSFLVIIVILAHPPICI
jgi:prolipoprotein diacylglyceryltransferase